MQIRICASFIAHFSNYDKKMLLAYSQNTLKELSRRVGESTTLRLAEFSFKHSKAESESQKFPDSPSQRVSDSPTRQVGESSTSRRWVEELFFDYEYLREFEAKIGTARKVV